MGFMTGLYSCLTLLWETILFKHEFPVRHCDHAVQKSILPPLASMNWHGFTEANGKERIFLKIYDSAFLAHTRTLLWRRKQSYTLGREVKMKGKRWHRNAVMSLDLQPEHSPHTYTFSHCNKLPASAHNTHFVS